jgi:hypothetical protein
MIGHLLYWIGYLQGRFQSLPVVDPFRCPDGQCLLDAGHSGPHFRIDR